MSTANFSRMNYNLPMICGKPFGELVREYLMEDHDADEVEELLEDSDGSEYWMLAQDEYDRAQEIAEDFSRSLTFYKVTVESGYYDGFMFQVETSEGIEYDEIDNEDARYYFDRCRSKVIRDSAAELRKIGRWLRSLTGFGFVEVVCTGRFSNGKATYSIVSPRTELLAAARA